MQNPYLGALVAIGYIGLVVLLMGGMAAFFGDAPDVEYLAPLIMLSLLVLSVATMGFLFFYRPLSLMLDGKRAEVLGYFARMAGTFTIGIALMITAAGFFRSTIIVPPQQPWATDPKDATYLIEDVPVSLVDGYAEMPSAPGAASKVVTRYFGNELSIDLDLDGRADTAFILTQERGGTGTFFYAVGALNTEGGYIGSDGYLLGDRIAPQPTTPSQNPRQKGVVVFNYADRAPGAPMTARPSVGKSAYLKLDPASMQWAIVMPDFEGESAYPDARGY